MLLRLPPLLEARFLKRYKRFLADIEFADGRQFTAHCPNPGRMTSCLPDQGRILVADHRGHPTRKLPFTWELSHCHGNWVLVNTQRTNQVARAAMEQGLIPELSRFKELKSEQKWGDSRFDFRLDQNTWVEVKQVTLRVGRVAAFPDAVTARGRKHLERLVELREAGNRAVMLYLVARQDVESYRPAGEVDPAYAEAWQAAREAGVEMLAYRLQIGPEGIELDQKLEPAPTV